MEKQSLVKEICPTTTQQWVKDGALLVDVREQVEFEKFAFDVPHLLHIPLSDFENRFTEIPQNKNVVLVCKDGTKSLRAAGFLVNHGYTQVVNMQHGLIRWVNKGFPIIGNPDVLNINTDCCTDSNCC